MPNPSSALIAVVSQKVYALFDVSENEARECGEGLVMLAEGWGGDGVGQLDRESLVVKHFGGRLKWRSESVRLKHEEQKQATYAAYESYIRARK